MIMAKFFDKDPYTFEREKRTFLHALKQFHASKGVQLSMFRIPKVSGRDLDFYLLFSKVTSLGGVVKVTNEHRWDEVCETLGFPPGCSQIGYVVRRHYVRYLEAYERLHFKGEEDEDKRIPVTKRPNTPITFIYRRDISDKVRQSQGFATEKCRSSEYDRIIFSLQSSLPNEVDFAINICTLLSNEGKHVIHLDKAPMLIDLLLAHGGIFYEGPGSLRKLFEDNWKQSVKRNFVQFWYDTITDKEVREVIGPSSKKPEENRQFKDPELFCVRKLGLSDVEGQRILQIAIIFRNLSFESHNVATMARHRTLYRFLLLLSHNSCTMLQQLGLDTLTNICNQMVLDSIDYVSTQLMFHTIHKGLEQKDKFVMLRSMELIEKLLVVDNNLDLLQRCLEPTVYAKVITLLTIHDIQLLLGALETMLVMSEREEPFCTKLSSVHCSIDVLVCLVTLDAQSLGADAFVGIKIVDHAPDGIHHPIVTMGKAPGQENAPLAGAPGPMGTPVKSNTPPVQRPPQAPSNSSASPTPPPSSQARDADMENLACQWLGAHYDSDMDSSVSNIDLYAEYLSACGKIMGRNILNSNDFMRCVKLVFPMVAGKKAEGESGPQFFISGIKRRPVPLPWKWQQAPPSAPSPSASAMIARMAQRHSPSPTISPSPTPPPKGGIFHQGGIPQRQLVAPPQGSPQMPSLPGQVNGKIPGHIHAPVAVSSQAHQALSAAGQFQPQMQQMRMQGAQMPGGQVMASARAPPPVYAQQMRPGAPLPQPGQPGQPQMVYQQVAHQPQQMPPQQMQVQNPQMLHHVTQAQQLQMQQQMTQSQVQQPNVQMSQPQMQQTLMQQPQMSQTQPPHAPVSVQSMQGQAYQQSGFAPSGQIVRQPLPQHSQPQAQHISQGAPPQQSVTPVSQGDNVSVADIIAGNMRVPQHQLNYNVQQQQTNLNGRLVNGPMQGQLVNSAQNNANVPQMNRLPQSTTTAQGAQEQFMSMPGQVLSSDTNSESSTELNLKGRSSRSRSNSGKKSPASSKSSKRTSSKSASPSRSPAITDGAPTSPQDSMEEASTEKCQPPLKFPLPDGEVKIEKIPNVHAVGVDDDDEDDGDDRTDLAEGIIRQIAGSPVPNQTSCDVLMDESESLVSDADTIIDEDLQHHGLNGDVTPTPPPPQQQLQPQQLQPQQLQPQQLQPQQLQPQQLQPQQLQHQTQVSANEKRLPEQVPSAGVFSQPQQQQQQHLLQAAPQYNVAPVANKAPGPGTQIMVSQPHHQQQFVIQKQIPTQCVVSRGVVNVQMHGGQTLLQTQPGTFVQANAVSASAGAVIRSNQGNFIQTQSGSFVQVQPQQLHMQGHQAIQNQGAFQGQPIQPLQVTWVQQPNAQGQIQHQVQQPINVVSGVQHLQPGQTMIVTNNGQQGSFPQTTILAQNSGQLLVQNVSAPPRTGLKPILPQPQGPKPILPHPPSTLSLPQGQALQGTQNVQITRFSSIPSFQVPLSPTNKDSPLIKQLLQQGPVLPAPGQPLSPQQHQQQPQQQQLQVIQPQQGQIVLNTIGQPQGSPMTHVQVVRQLPTGMTVQSAPTIGNIPQIQLHHQPILPALPGTPSPNRTPSKPKKSKSKHKKKDKEKDKNKNGHVKDNGKTKVDGVGEANADKNGGGKTNNYSINVISQQGEKKVVGVMYNGLPVDTNTGCNNSSDPSSQEQDTDAPAKGMPNGYISDKLSNDVKVGKGVIVSPLAAKDIESLFRKSPQTIGDKVDSVVEQLKRDMSSGASENGMLADKLGKHNHVVNGDVGPSPKDALVKDRYDNNTVSDRIDRLLHGAVPNLSQPNIPTSSTPNNPNPKSLVAFCNDIRTTFPSTVPSVTVGAVANANNNNQLNASQSVPVSTTNSCSTVSHTGGDPVVRTHGVTSGTNPSSNQRLDSNNLNPKQGGASAPLPPTTSSQVSLPNPAGHPPSPLTVQVPTNPPSSTPSFKRPIDEVLQSPDSKSSSTSNPLASPTNPAPPSPSPSRSSKKRRHSSSSSTSSSSRKSSSSKAAPAPAPAPAPIAKQYVCDWKGCSRNFGSAKALHTHITMHHVLSINYMGICEWEGCDRIQRKRWSVVSHIMDKHCSEAAVQASIEKRAQRAAQPTPPPSQDSSPQPPPIVYNAHTAYHAIKRSLVSPSLKELVGENEGPVTKSIRLTAALILKNIATYSALGRREIQRHELLLARLAISNTESSTTLAKCLRELNRDS